MGTFDMDIDGNVAVFVMDDGENRLGTKNTHAWNAALDAVSHDANVSAMVVVGAGRYWSTGLDLDELDEMDGRTRKSFMHDVDLLLGRILIAPFATVAALNGHTYAAGALLALAFDYRVMRQDQGYFCLPSVDVGIPFSPGMSALVSSKVPQPIAHDLVVSCRRIGGQEACSAGVVHRAVEADAVLPIARELAHAYAGKDPITLSTVKKRMYPEAASMLTVE